MAKTNFVKSFRGQRKCQWTGEDSYRSCDQLLGDHFFRTVRSIEDVNATKPTDAEHPSIADHPFTQKPLKCGSCGNPINLGDGYKWVAPRAHRAAPGIKKVRHTGCPGWKPSELTSSQHLATIYAGQEAADEAISALTIPTVVEDAETYLSDLTEIASAAAEDIMGAAESYRESAEAIEEGFGHPTYQSEELENNAYEIESWCDEIGSVQVEEFAEEFVCAECGLDEFDDEHQDSDDENFHDYDEDPTPLEDWAVEQQDLVREIIDSMPI